MPPTFDRRAVSARTDIALLILRVVFGLTFAAHGWQKLFIFGLAGVTHSFAGMGVPLPQIAGPAIGCLELIGGAALILGVFTRTVGIALACDMVGAIAMVRAKGGFFAPSGIELELALFCVAAALAIAGAGEYSIDVMLAGRRADAAVRPRNRGSR
jgi:putative oxidoreductase